MSSFCNLMVLFELHFIFPSELHGCFVVGLSFGLVFIHTKYESNRWVSGKVNTEICFLFLFFFVLLLFKFDSISNTQHIKFYIFFFPNGAVLQKSYCV